MALSYLCSTCEQALYPDVLEESSLNNERVGSHHATYESFLNAIDNGCAICTTIDKRLQQSGASTASGAETGCFPSSYDYRLTGARVQFTVHYETPSNWKGMNSSGLV